MRKKEKKRSFFSKNPDLCLCQHEIQIVLGVGLNPGNSQGFSKETVWELFRMSSLGLTIKELQLCGVSRIYILIGVKKKSSKYNVSFSSISVLWIFGCDPLNLAHYVCQAWPSASPFSSHVIIMSWFFRVYSFLPLSFNSSQTKSIRNSLLFLSCSNGKQW